MKNYDVKASAIDLATKSKITVEGKRLAYLVPNMFNKITSGYGKKMLAYISSNVAAVEPAPVPAVSTNTTSESVETVPVKTEPQVAQVNPAVPVVNENPVTQEDNKNDDVVKNNTEINAKEKNYILKVLQTDVDYLINKQKRVVGAPRRLLISTVFVQKLLAHRANAVKENFDLAKKLSTVPSEPVKVEIPVDPKEAGVARYVILMNKRKEAITIKQTCEKEMTELVNEFGITLDMVNAELAKGNMKKIG